MDIQNVVAISGMPGLHRVITNRPNGLIIEDLVTKKTSFVSSRRHHFTPLESIAIYTLEGTEELIKIFKTIKEKQDTIPLPPHKGTKEEYMQFFDEILPNYDEDRVYMRDMTKVVKWFKQLDELGLTNPVKKTEEE